MLKDKVAIVTGGTRGIGYAIVKKYLENGAKVAVLGSKPETVEITMSKLKEENSSWDIMGASPNLMDENDVSKTFADVANKWGSLDILINNAGVSARESIYQYNVEDFMKTIDINLNSVFICSQAAVKIMKPQGGGVIINTSSMVSLYGQPSGSAYPASKFALNGLTKSLARELGRDNIRVNAVAPGITRTDMVASLPDDIIKPLIATIPLGRVGEPEDVANAFLFLGSDMSSYITGEILSVDGAARS